MLRPSQVSDFVLELTGVERLFVRTPLLALGEFRCPVDHPQFRGGGPQTCAYVAFPRTPVRISPHHGRPEICTPANACFYNVGDSYDRHRVGEKGDHCNWIALSPTLLRELTEAVIGDSSLPAFAGAFSPLASAAFLAQRRLFDRMSTTDPMSTLEAEEYVYPLLKRLLADATAVWSRSAGGKRESQVGPARHRLKVVDDIRQQIALNPCENHSLSDLARAAGCSAGHLARSFRAVAGTTLHEYRNRLRLRIALPLLPDCRQNIAALALDLGFSSHSHFSDVFRRHFGVTPSDYATDPRRDVRVRRLVSNNK